MAAFLQNVLAFIRFNSTAFSIVDQVQKNMVCKCERGFYYAMTNKIRRWNFRLSGESKWKSHEAKRGLLLTLLHACLQTISISKDTYGISSRGEVLQKELKQDTKQLGREYHYNYNHPLLVSQR